MIPPVFRSVIDETGKVVTVDVQTGSEATFKPVISHISEGTEIVTTAHPAGTSKSPPLLTSAARIPDVLIARVEGVIRLLIPRFADEL